MGLVTTKEMFKKAYDGGYAIGAFNVNNMEIIQGIVDAAIKTNSPVILQVSSGARKYANPIYLRKLVEAAIEYTKSLGKDIDIVLHLDHGDSFEICKDCIDSGFTSVMFDGSKLDYEENIRITKQVVDYAHPRGVVVEAELGKLAGIEDDVKVNNDDAMFTDPMEAKEFVERTGCDSLAIAIGTSHGAFKFKGEPKLRFDILEKVTNLLPGFPLVLHGASSVPQEFVDMCNKYGGNIPGAKGVPEDMLREAAKYGVCKINIDSDIRLAMTANIRQCFEKTPEVFDPRSYLGEARNAVMDMVEHKIVNVLGCNNKM
ncbi:MAG: fructose,6-bisphosphate aldolase, class [Clostridia bacterium]|jgi:fructose-bisphosphate aldolase class II|nr:fructose,6-bisphosphate aldolase, class [Clostridia bacterium]